MEALSVRKGDNHATIEHSHRLDGDSRGENDLIVPASSLSLLIKVYLNGRIISGKTYDSLLDRIGYSFSESEVWSAMGYQCSLSIDSGISITLNCGIFTPLSNELIPCNRRPISSNTSVRKVRVLQSVALTLRYFTPFSALPFEDMLEDFEYLMRSWLVNMEYSFPLVFSYYGRQYFRLNYNVICRTIDELFDPRLGCEITADNNIDKYAILLCNLAKLQEKIMTEFNLLEVMRGYYLSSSRRSSTKSVSHYTSNVNIKKFVYRISFFEQVASTFAGESARSPPH